SRIVLRNAIECCSRLTVRPILDYDPFYLGRIIRSEYRTQGFRDHLSLVIRSYDYADRLRKTSRPAATETRGQPDDGEGSQHNERRCNDHERPKKFLRGVKNREPGSGDKIVQRMSRRLDRGHEGITRCAQKSAQGDN